MNNQLQGDPQGLSYIIKEGKHHIPADQYIREVTKNSEEAIQRKQKEDPNYIGDIIFKRDAEYYNQNKVSKLSIIDTGDGMPYEFLDLYMLKLGYSTRNNKHKNWGAGFKLCALPFNPYGITIKSWTKHHPQGYMIWVRYNETKQVYEAKLFKKNQKVLRLRDESKPKEIKTTGTQITFLGKSKTDDTMEFPELLSKGGLFKGGRTSKSGWIPSYLNVKKYLLEENIRYKYEDPDETKNNRNIQGHHHFLNTFALDSGSVPLSNARMDWFLLPERNDFKMTQAYALVTGQLCQVFQDEVIKIDYAGKSDRNPLAAWGHQYSKYRVALILKLAEDEFKPNLERTEVGKDGVKTAEYIDNWKEEWQSKTPKALQDLEAEMAKAALEKASNFDEELKKHAKLFRSDQYMATTKGDTSIEKDKILKTGGHKNRLGEENQDSEGHSGPNPDKEYGEVEQELGVKIDRSGNRGVLTKNNPYPTVGYVEEGVEASVATYIHDGYCVDINTDSSQIQQLVEHRVKRDRKNNYETVKTMMIEIISFQLKQQVAHIYNMTGWDTERIEKALSCEALSACLANKSLLLEKLDEKLKETKSVITGNGKDKLPLIPLTNIHSYDPNKYVYKNSRK